MSGRRVPRALVVLAATAIVCVPAITALAYQYIRDGQNRVVHLHVGAYNVYNDINDSGRMQLQAGEAIDNWQAVLTAPARDTVPVTHSSVLDNAEVRFYDYNFTVADSGTGVIWSEAWHQAGRVNVAFDNDRELDWSDQLQQHKACNALGNILGLDDAYSSGDCMESGSTYAMTSGAAADMVDDFYGPNLTFGDQLYTNRANLESSTSYPLAATADGHAIKSVTVKLDGTQIASKSITPCDANCSVGVSPNVGPLSVGTHTISATATNEFGKSHTDSFTAVVPPNTVIDSGPNGPTNDATPTFTYHSPTSGVTFQCRIDGASFAACPAAGYTPSAALADGSHTFSVRANDGGHVDPTPASRTFTVDTIRPVLNASGDFTDQTNPLVGAGPLEDVTATDQGTGVTRAVLKVDGTEVETLDADEDCAAPCSMDDSFFPELSELAAGSHSFAMFATDAAGNNSATRSGSFILDPSAPQIAVTGALADSSEGPLQSATAAASIAATDNAAGDSGIASVEVTVDDETDRTYPQTCAPSCPSSVSASYTYSKASWGPGPHVVAFTATDKAGNQQTTTLDVDEPSADPVATCPTPQSQQQDPGQTVTASGAVSQAIAPAVQPTTDPATDTSDPDNPDTLDPTLTTSDDGPEWMQSEATMSLDEISQGPAPSINVGDQLCLVPTQTTAADTPQAEETMAGGDIQVYPNTATNTDTIVRPTVGGEDIIESIRGSTAPSSYSFAVGIPPGDQLQELTNGGVAVVNPSQPAPADPVAPDPYAAMSATQITNDLPDAGTQLNEYDRAVTSAEQETSHSVDAVIQPPQIVNSDSSTTFSTLALSGSTITVDVPNGAKAIVLKAHSKVPAPKAAPSWYVQVPRKDLINQLEIFACDFAAKGLVGNRLLIFNFENVAQYGDDSFGTFNGHHLHNGSIYHALHSAALAYGSTGHGGRACYPGSGEATIIYGNSNRHLEGYQQPITKWKGAGQAQAHVVGRLRGHLIGHEHAGAGGDLEPTYASPSKTLDLAVGASQPHGGPYVDFGTGNTSDTTNWTESQLCDVAYSGNGNRMPLPQIFRPAESKRWGNVQHDCGGGFRFLGVYTSWAQNKACGFCSSSLNGKHFGPAHAWRHLRHASNAPVGHEISDAQG